MFFLPSMRHGSLSVLTANQPALWGPAATILAQSLINPSTSVTRAPKALHSMKFDCGTSRGMKMWASMPAAAAYAAMALAALPADGIATFLIPSSTAIVTAQESPRALKEPVGFSPSSLIQRSEAPRLFHRQ